MQAYQDPQELVYLIFHCHQLLSNHSGIGFYPRERPTFKTAIIRASQELATWRPGNKGALFEAVARLAVGIGNAFDDGRPTAFLVAEVLLTEGGFTIVHSDRQQIQADFEDAVQQKRFTDVVQLFQHHWG